MIIEFTPLCKNAVEKKEPIKLSLEVGNQSRTFATMLSSEILKTYGKDALSEDSIQIKAIGNAGNSFGAFLLKGIKLEIIGDSNDYLGKGLSGGKIIAKISNEATFHLKKISSQEMLVCMEQPRVKCI